MTNNNVAIRISNVTKEFKITEQKGDPILGLFSSNSKGNGKSRVVQILKGISFEIGRGETVAIVGKNGAGKSTLLKIIAGIMQPTSGSVEVKGKLTSLLGRGVGFNKNMTATDNIILYGMLLGLTKREITYKVPEVLEYAELEDYADVEIDHFSPGMLARLAFSTSIMVDSDIMLMDEALAVGDYAFHQKSFDSFLELKRQARTIVFVSHSIEQVKRISDRAILIHDGKVELDDKPEAVIKRYRELSAKNEGANPQNDNNDFEDNNRNVIYPNDSPFVQGLTQAMINRNNMRAFVLVDKNAEQVKEKNILDIGSHDGRFMYAALRSGAKFVEGVEPRLKLVEVARSNLQYYKIDPDRYKLTGSNIIRRLKEIQPYSYHTVFCFGILDKVVNRYGLIKELARLKPSCLIIDTIVGDSSSIEEEVGSQQAASGSNHQIGNMAILTRNVIESLLTTHGFTFKYIDWQEEGINGWDGLEEYRNLERISILATIARQ